MWVPCSIAHVDIYISKEFSTVEKGCIIDGITEWQKATLGLISFHIVDLNATQLIPDNIGDSWYNMNFIKIDTGGLVEMLERSDDTIGTVIGYAHAMFGCNFSGLCTSRARTKKRLKRLTMHEMGHMLGLTHINKKAIMNRYITRTTAKISKQDLAQLIAVWRDYISNSS